MCEIIQFRDAVSARYARAVSVMNELVCQFDADRPSQRLVDSLTGAEAEVDRYTLTLVNMGLSAPEIARIGREYA